MSFINTQGLGLQQNFESAKQAGQQQQQTALQTYDQEIDNNKLLSEDRQQQLKERVRQFVEPMSQEVFRISAERLLKKHGLKKYYDAIKSGDSKKLADTLVDDVKTRGTQFINGKADAFMKAKGFSDEDIAGIKDGFKTGNFSGQAQSKLSDLFNDSENFSQLKDIVTAGKNVGLSDDDIKNLPQSLVDNVREIPQTINSGLENATNNLANGIASQNPPSVPDVNINSANMGEHVSQLGGGNGIQQLQQQLAQEAQERVRTVAPPVEETRPFGGAEEGLEGLFEL